MSVAPSAQIAEFLDFRVRVSNVVFHGQAGGIVDTNITAQTPENAADLESKQFGVGATGSSVGSFNT
jgi:hypothetical protein